jgi:23S rRNA (cytosine1962-C5)-methyltransferase
MEVIRNHIKKFYKSFSGDAGRIFHGRGNCFPGLEHIVVESFPPVALITLFKETNDVLLNKLISFLQDAAGTKLSTVAIQRRYLPQTPYEVVFGELPEKHIVKEYGSQFLINLNHAQNAGLFLDMSEGRKWLKENSSNKRVLNLFSYTCLYQ